jgi:hypothetical protein
MHASEISALQERPNVYIPQQVLRVGEGWTARGYLALPRRESKDDVLALRKQVPVPTVYKTWAISQVVCGDRSRSNQYFLAAAMDPKVVHGSDDGAKAAGLGGN